MELNKVVFAHCLNNGQTMRSIVATDVLREYMRRFFIKDPNGNVNEQHNVFTQEAYEYKRLAGYAITHFMHEDIEHIMQSIKSSRGDDVVAIPNDNPLSSIFKDEMIGMNIGDSNSYNYALNYTSPGGLTVKNLAPDVRFISLRKDEAGATVRIAHGPKSTERIVDAIYEMARVKVTKLIEEAEITINVILERAAANEEQLTQQTEICNQWRQLFADALIERSTIEDKIHFIKSQALCTAMSAANSNEITYTKRWSQSDLKPKHPMRMLNEGDRWIALLQGLQLATPAADRFVSAKCRLGTREAESSADNELKFTLFVNALEFSSDEITYHTTVDATLNSIGHNHQVGFNFDDCVATNLAILDKDELFLKSRDLRRICEREYPPDSYHKLISRIADRVPHAINMLLFKELLSARRDLVMLSQRVGLAGQVMSGGFC
jgi:uncharacterized protein with PIN domain